jgi:alkylation response protein AidB-like acyl-CoA dehydrogenase
MLLEAARLMVLNAAALLDQFGNKRSEALKALSMAKAYVPRLICDLVDMVIQVFGAEGVSQD